MLCMYFLFCSLCRKVHKFYNTVKRSVSSTKTLKERSSQRLIFGKKIAKVVGLSKANVDLKKMLVRICFGFENSGFPPQIIHFFIGFSISFTIHFGGFPPIFGSTPICLEFFGSRSFHLTPWNLLSEFVGAMENTGWPFAMVSEANGGRLLWEINEGICWMKKLQLSADQDYQVQRAIFWDVNLPLVSISWCRCIQLVLLPVISRGPELHLQVTNL